MAVSTTLAMVSVQLWFLVAFAGCGSLGFEGWLLDGLPGKPVDVRVVQIENEDVGFLVTTSGRLGGVDTTGFTIVRGDGSRVGEPQVFEGSLPDTYYDSSLSRPVASFKLLLKKPGGGATILYFKDLKFTESNKIDADLLGAGFIEDELWTLSEGILRFRDSKSFEELHRVELALEPKPWWGAGYLLPFLSSRVGEENGVFALVGSNFVVARKSFHVIRNLDPLETEGCEAISMFLSSRADRIYAFWARDSAYESFLSIVDTAEMTPREESTALGGFPKEIEFFRAGEKDGIVVGLSTHDQIASFDADGAALWSRAQKHQTMAIDGNLNLLWLIDGSTLTALSLIDGSISREIALGAEIENPRCLRAVKGGFIIAAESWTKSEGTSETLGGKLYYVAVKELQTDN
ncbi:MAG: hypothetical protein NUW37_15630 [Planctomycetes bacterium]|nr:hypothetical protein [Planctomycetota bacterium]